MSDKTNAPFIEDRIPLDGIRETAVDIVELYGGEVTSAGEDGMEFTLPVRRGVAASGGVACQMTWTRGEDGLGVVTLMAGREVSRPGAAHIAILVAGSIGALFWLVWPFFPNMGPVAWVGGLMAFGAYFLTLRGTSRGVAFDLLQRLARQQRERLGPRP